MALLEVTDLRKDFQSEAGVVSALRGVDLSIEPGEFVAIMGPSGSGKTTLMNILGFLDVPSSGSYRFEGRDASRLSPDQRADIRCQRIGFVFQMYNLLSRMTAFENVELPMLYAGVPRRERLDRARKMLEAVGLSHRMEHWPSQLSGGEQQRVAIARAMAGNPSLVLADEPTGALDSETGQEIMRFLTRFNEQGTSIVIVTHDPEVAKLANRIVRLSDGLVHLGRQKKVWVTRSLQEGQRRKAEGGEPRS